MFITRRLFLLAFGPDGAEGGAGAQAPSVETPGSTADTPPGTGTPDQQPDTAQVNWEDRYKDVQAWATRSAQRVTELEQYEQLVNDWNSEDPEAQRRAAERLGIQLEDPSQQSDPRYADDDPMAQRLAALEAERAQERQQAQEEQQYTSYRQMVDPQLDQMGVPKGIHDLVAEAALNLPPVHTPQGTEPNLKAALAQVEQIVLAAADLPSVQQKVVESYRASKKAPHIGQSGTAGTQTPNLDNRSERQQWMAERLMADQEGF